jgi:signal transduction histidine kinase
MEPLSKLISRLSSGLFLLMLTGNILVVGSLFFLLEGLHLSLLDAAAVIGIIAVVVSGILAINGAKYALIPFQAIWQAIMHLAQNSNSIAAPDVEHLKLGKDIVKHLTNHIYDLASATGPFKAEQGNQSAPVTGIGLAQDILERFPLPVFVLNSNQVIANVNQAALTFTQAENPVGKKIYDALSLSFGNEHTLENWLAEMHASRAVGQTSWRRVRLQLPDEKGMKQFDLAAYYTKDNPAGYETILTMFDQTDRYQHDDDAVAYVSLAVHELRTPLTILRGYIEVFEEEVGHNLSPELQDFMHKMSASAQTLAAFVSNILNVARIDENQLTLRLQEANWSQLLPEICKDLELRAKVRGKEIKYDIQPDLPPVGVDRISIYEVVSNLVDNAIKYGRDSKQIIVHAHLGKDGNIETSVQDFGIGIPESAMKNLFTKFYRSHRSKAQVGGSGLGLYLVKAIVTAHGGQVWAQSKEGEGSTFGFSLLPYSHAANDLKGDQEITRQAHGWIKNHSLYRR